MKRLLVAEAAKRDLPKIATYTEDKWGAEQKHTYMNAFRDQLAALRVNPLIGVNRNDVRPGYRSITCGRHQIFYRESDTSVVVVRVHHERQDVHHHLRVD